jgi:hypothetical protein
MTDRDDPGQEQRVSEDAKAKEREGHGTVPDVTSQKPEGEAGEIKEALHQLEEEKGDWSKDR